MYVLFFHSSNRGKVERAKEKMMIMLKIVKEPVRDGKKCITTHFKNLFIFILFFNRIERSAYKQ